MDNQNKQKKKSKVNVFTFWFKQMFLGDNIASKELDVMFEEQVQSPFRTIMENFFANKTAMFGLYAIVAIMLLCFILPIFFPMNLYYNDSTQQDISPGFNFMKIPKALANNALEISVGSTFGVGIDRNGKLYQWGKPVKKMVATFPKEEGKYTMVSAGKDHALAIKEDGTLITWGNDRHNLAKIPRELTQGDPIKQIYAGDQFSLALKEDGNMYFWGNSSLITMTQNSIGRKIQGQIQSFVASSDNVIVVLNDGSLNVLGIKGTPVHRVPEEVQGNVKQLALTKDAALALTTDGKLHVWGQDRNGLLNIPEEITGNIKEIGRGRNHFVVVDEQNQVFGWGSNYLGQINIPTSLAKGSLDINHMSSDYYQNYAILENGKVETFGLKGYLMGTDGFGRDLFKRLIVGGRLTLTVGASAVIIAMIIGVLVGGIAGFYGGKVDNILMRFSEIMGSIPFLPFAMTLSAVLGNKVTELQRILIIMAILGFLSWPGLARLVRGQILAEREKEFVTAAKAVGIKERAIIFKHILPNVISVVIVNVTLRYATSLLTESSLSFLGFGIVEPSPTWGNMMTGSQNADVIANKWWRWAFPAIALSLSTVSINLLGDGLGDAIDPKSHER